MARNQGIYNVCGKQFEVAVSLNHDTMISFDSTSDSEYQNLNKGVRRVGMIAV